MVPNHLHAHMEAARWFLSNEPARRRNKLIVAAYVAVENALVAQGTFVKLYAFADSYFDWDGLRAEIKYMLQCAQVAMRRVKFDRDTLCIEIDACKQCELPRHSHAQDKCPFQSTNFVPKYPPGDVVVLDSV